MWAGCQDPFVTKKRARTSEPHVGKDAEIEGAPRQLQRRTHRIHRGGDRSGGPTVAAADIPRDCYNTSGTGETAPVNGVGLVCALWLHDP